MLIFSGFLTGLLVGMTGVGGGALMTPLLLLLFGVAPATAVGTDLFFAALTKVVAGGVHQAKGLIDWQVLKAMWLGSLPGASITIMLVHHELISFETTFLKELIAYLVLVTAIGIFLQKYLQQIGKTLRLKRQDIFKSVQIPMTVLAGGAIGFLVTLTSVGAGALGAVLLTYLYPLRMTPARLVATDIVHAIPLALFAGFGHLLIGHVDFELLALLLIGSIPGAYVGAKLSAKLPAKVIKYFLAFILFAIAIKLLMAAK